MALDDDGGNVPAAWYQVACRILWRALILLPLIVLAGFIGSNLWLLSPWATGMAEKELGQRTGLEWQVGSITWSPWAGVTLKSARVLVPGESEHPVATINKIKLRPHWKALLRRQLSVRELAVIEPVIELPLELLTALPAGSEVRDKLPPEPPALAAAPQQTSPAPPPSTASLADYAQVGKPPALVSQVLAQQQQTMDKPAPAALERPAAGLPTRIRIKDARIRLFSTSRQMDVCTIEKLSVDMPVSGEDAGGYVQVAGMQVSGLGAMPDFKQALAWKRPRLEIEERELDLGGVQVVMRVQLGITNSKSLLPFLVDMVIKPQKVESLASLEKRSVHASAEMLAARFRMLGMLASPLSWRAEAILVGESVTMQAGRGRPRVTFDAMYFPVVLHQGKLHLMGFKMLGEDLSVLGNGRVSMRGGLISITRLVASPEVAEVMEKSFKRAGMADTWWWYNMVTPDRKVRDLVISGSIFDPVIDAGPQHAAMPLRQLIGLIMQPAEDLPEDAPLLQPQPESETVPAEPKDLES